MSKALALVLGLVLVSSTAHAAGIDATCNMFVPPGQTATLSSDLSCNLGGVAIYLDAKSTLDLNGFTLTVAEDMTAVFCQHVSCSVISSATGPGVLEGNFEAYYGLISNLQQDERPVIRKLVIDNVIIQNFEKQACTAPSSARAISAG